MATIPSDFGVGGSGLAPRGGHGSPTLVEIMNDVADDFTEIRTQFIALLQKMDGDAGITDTDYEATLTPAALLTQKA